MPELESTRASDPESYDIWEAGRRRYIKRVCHVLPPCREMPVIACRAMDVIRSDARWYQHVNYHSMALEMILAGKAEYRRAGEILVAGPGMLYVVARGSNVRMSVSGRQQRRKLTLILRGGALDSIADCLGFGRDLLLKLSQPRQTEAMMREIERSIAESESPEYISAKTYELLLHLSLEFKRTPEALRPAMDWIAEKPYDKITVPALAARCGLSVSTLRRRFVAEYGIPPVRYLMTRRLSLSRDLLKGERSLKEIAARCGFSSPLLFTRAFRDRFGETPSACRKRLRMESGASPVFPE